MESQLSYFKSQKIMLLKSCTQYARKFGKLNSGHRAGRDVFIPIPNRGIAKEWSNYYIIALISHASKVMLKILQARLQQYVNRKLPDVQTGFRKGRGTRDQIANIHWIIKKSKRIPEKTSSSASLTVSKPLWITTNGEKFLKKWEYQNTLPASWETRMQVKKQQLEPDMELVPLTGSKLVKEYIKVVYCHLAYLTYKQSTLCEMLDWMKHKLESRLLWEISTTSDMQMTPSLSQKAKRNLRASW